MNTLSHFLLALALVSLVFGISMEYMIVVFLASVLLDLDHVPYTIRNRGRLAEKKFGAEARSRFHEMYGVALFSVLISVASLFFDQALIGVLAFSLILHYSVDFILGKSRPFYPFSQKKLFLGLCSERSRVVIEVIITILSLVIIWLQAGSWIL